MAGAAGRRSRSSFEACAKGESDQSQHEQDENGEKANYHHGGRENGRVICYGRINRARYYAPDREESQYGSNQCAASRIGP